MMPMDIASASPINSAFNWDNLPLHQTPFIIGKLLQEIPMAMSRPLMCFSLRCYNLILNNSTKASLHKKKTGPESPAEIYSTLW